MMPPKKTKILGCGEPMPSVSVQLPPYVVTKARGGGVCFYFQVPKRLRPSGWAGAYRLPLAHDKRTGKADAAELAAVVADGEALYQRLTGEKGELPAAIARLNTLPWLIQAFDHHLKTTPRERPIAKGTLRQYAWAARKVLEWSRLSGHPLVRLLTRPAIIEFLSGLNDTPTARKHVAGYLRNLLFFAMDKGVRDDNPAVKIKTETPEAHVHIWTDAELEIMIGAADEMGYPNVATAMLIAHDEGPRPCDVLAFQRFRDYTPTEGCFRYYQKKTKDWVISPAGKRVRARLAKQPAEQLMLVVNPNTGKRYNERVFSRDFDRVREKTDLTHLQFRHLRHTFVVKAKRADLDSISIAAKTGHNPKSVEDMLRKHYLPHDSEVAMNATAKIEAYRERKSDAKV